MFSISQVKKSIHVFLDFLLTRYLIRGLGKSLGEIDLIRLGSDYGGWIIPSYIKEKSGSLNISLISGGLGTDISFDLEMLDLGATVVGIDPTPKSLEYVKSIVKSNKNFELIEACISHTGEPIVLFPPANSEHASWSSAQTSSDGGVIFPCTTLAELLENSKISESNLLILKLDVEGAEIPILMQAAEISKIEVCLAELDFVARKSFKRIGPKISSARLARRAILKMAESGFTLIALEGYNFTWVRDFRLEYFQEREIQK